MRTARSSWHTLVSENITFPLLLLRAVNMTFCIDPPPCDKKNKQKKLTMKEII